MHILGQVPARPVVGRTWAEAKAAWFTVLGYEVHAEQVARFHQSDARVKIVSAPARTSKSMSAAADILPYVMPTDPPCDSLHWIIGPTYPTNKEFAYLYDWIVTEQRFRSQDLHITNARNNPSNGDMLIVMEHRMPGRKKSRSIIQGMSSTNEKALQGEEVTTAILSEAAEHPPHILDKYLLTRCWKILIPTTPKPYAAHILQMIEDGEKDPRLGIEHFTFPRSANPTYNKERFEQAKARAEAKVGKGNAEKDPWFAEQFLGHWVYYTGRAVPFDEARNVIQHDEIAGYDMYKKFVSTDYGFNDPAVAHFWAVLPTGSLVIYDEIYESGLTTEKFVEKIQNKLENWGHNPDYYVGDPKRPEVSAVFQEAGLPIWPRGNRRALADRAAGHRRLVDLLASGPDPRFPGLLVHKRCAKTLTEWRHLRYKEDSRDEYGTTALEGADHAFDSGRYGVQSRPSPYSEPETRDDWMKEHLREARRASLQSMNSFHAVNDLGRFTR